MKMLRQSCIPYLVMFLIIALFLIPSLFACKTESANSATNSTADVIKLPKPIFSSNTSIESALLLRRSIRSYKNAPLTLQEISQLLWSAQGVSDSSSGFRYRTAPSAGGLYPLEIYVIVGNATGLINGIYKYRPVPHELIKIVEGDKRTELFNVALGQTSIQTAPIVIVFSAVFERTSIKYGSRAERYIYMEVGHAAENLYLQCVSLGLGTVAIGAFSDSGVKEAINMPDNESPVYIMPVGKNGIEIGMIN